MAAHLVLGLLLSFANFAVAQPLIEKDERVDINWTKLKVQYYGYAEPISLSEGQELKGVEKRAWKDALSYISKKSRDLYIKAFEDLEFSPKELTEKSNAVAQVSSQSAMSINTIYYSHGGVQVVLENQLPKIFESKGLKFSQKETGAMGTTHYSGIHIRLSQRTKPRVFYKIIDEEGKILFDYRNLSEEAFQKNLTGRWVLKPTPQEIDGIVGSQPIEIDALVVKEGLFQVKRTDWENAVLGHKGFLLGGVILLSM